MISFIIPAHNEQAGIGKTLQAIHDSARVVGQPYEIIVVDDASTDATAEITRQYNATVLSVNHRQIAATRNSGGRVATGGRLFFVDADTTINPRAVASALRYMDKGAVGGGAPTLFEGNLPLYVRLFPFLPVLGIKLVGLPGGAFMFCTREAFHAVGGFNERFYWAEEGVFALALKRQGRFVVLWKPVFTSGRRFRTLSLQFPAFVARMIFSPLKTFTRRSSVEKIWYDSNRDDDQKVPASFAVKVSNAMMLLIVTVLVTGPLWNFVPRSLTPWSSPLGKIRFVIGSFVCHVGLVFWPGAILTIWSLLRHFLVASMFRQKRWKEWIRLAVLSALFLWLAWDCTRGVVRFWTWLYHGLVHFYSG